MMVDKYLHLYLTFLTLVATLVSSQSNRPRKVDSKYFAIGEIVHPILRNEINQVYFEEYYSNNRAVLSLWNGLANITFVESVQEGKTWKIYGKNCSFYTVEDWKSEHIPPDLRVYETENGNPVFPIRQLLNLKDEHFVSGGDQKTIYRNIETRKYVYKIPTDRSDIYTQVEAFWSDDSTKTTSKYKIIPVGFKILSNAGGKITKHQYININMFVEGDESGKNIQPIRGVFCPEVKKSPMMRDIIKKMTTFSFSTELVITDELAMKHIDVWLDLSNNLVRHDFVPTDVKPTRLTRIASMNQGSGTVYEMRGGHYGAATCEVKTVSNVKFDPQVFVPEEKASKIDSFFGFDSTDYYTSGKTNEYGVPCQLFHGQRTDWPPDTPGITTLWEWCIVNMTETSFKYDEEHFPLVTLNILVTKSPFNISSGYYYEGKKFTHHFYNIHSYPSNQLDANYFDISKCFNADQLKTLSFVVNLNETTFRALKEDISNVNFILQWRNTIFDAAGLQPTSLRLSKPILDFLNTSNSMTVKFRIMDRHPNVAESVEPISLMQGIENIQIKVDSSALVVTYKKGANSYELKAQPGSLRMMESFNPTDDRDAADLGYASGTMAGVAIVMLLIGAALGIGAIVLKKKFYDKR